MKFKTITEGRQAVVYNHLGEGRLLKGPQRVFLFRERLEMLQEYSANRHQYIVCKDKDGVVKHLRGPCSMFFNTLVYDEMRVEDATKVDASHMVVVYKRMKAGEVVRRVITGPTVFVPEAEEWLHKFKWHGTDPENKTRMVPGLNSFIQLTTIPDSFYYNVSEVRTNDDVVITVKVMIFYRLQDVHKMLDTTHDPIADMINALCADVIAFTGKHSYTEFLEKTDRLSSLDTYPQLLQRVERVGFCVDQVVYRGYHATKQLQEMHNSAIHSRTTLRLEMDLAEQEQLLQTLKLEKEEARSKLRQELALSREQHRRQMEESQKQLWLELERLTEEQRISLTCATSDLHLEFEKKENEHKLEQLTILAQLGVDLTKYLTCQTEPRVTQEVQVVTD